MANTKSLALVASSSQYGIAADGAPFDITDNLTIECWLYLTNLPGGSYYIFDKEHAAAGQTSWDLHLNTSTGKIEMKIVSNGTPSVSTVTIGITTDAVFTAGNLNTWLHYAVVCSGNTMTMYVNGSSVGVSYDYQAASSIFSGSANVSIGCFSDDSPSAFWNGKIDELRVWNDVRTSTEISNNYQVELVGDEANLVAYYKFNDSALDETTNNNDITLYGTPSYSTDVPFVGVEPSESVSPSVSTSISVSRSPSVSVSLSPSISSSISVSRSPSVSVSISPSISRSVSPSISFSISPSLSPSPSPGWANYTRGDYVALPADDADLETNYTAQDVIDVAANDTDRVGQTADAQYAIHQFKDYVTGLANITLETKLRSSLAPLTSIVKLQIYNRTTTTWTDVDSDNLAAANEEFILTGNILVADLIADYISPSKVISCRVWQLSQ